MAIKHPMGIESKKGVRIAMPTNPNLALSLTQLLVLLVNFFLGFFLLNNPVFLLNQFQILRIPELKYMKTMIPKVPEDIPNNTDSQKDNFSSRIKKGTITANLKDAIIAAMIISSQVVSIIVLLHKPNHLHPLIRE